MSSSKSPTTPALSANDETTPLLGPSHAGVTAQANEEPLRHETPENNHDVAGEEEDDKPLPKGQIFLLCYARLVEPIAFFSIFPFINQMIWETGNLNKADVGFYSGLIESLFSLTQMMLMISWGYAADHLGRKPVLVFSLAGMSIATAFFGLSKKIWQMVVFRCSAGVFAGTVVTIRAMLSENSTRKTQARAFSYFAFTNNLGIFIGPLIGGTLSNPAEQYPFVFGRLHFFKDYPYALPTFVVGAIGVSAVITSVFFVKETLDRKLIKNPVLNPPMSTWELIKFPGVATVVYLYGHIMLLAFAYTAVSPLFWFTEVDLGGFGFSPFQISMFLGLAGISQALWTLLVFPPLQHRFGTGGVLRGCSIAWPILFAFCPLCNLFLRNRWKLAFWITAPIGLALGSGVSMAFTAIQLALNDIAPTHATLGTLNALALTLVSAIRAFAPALFSSIFATGARTQILDGYLVWLVLIAIALAFTLAIRCLPEKAEGKLKPEAEAE